MAEHVSAGGRAVKPIHKRSQQWAGLPFADLGEVARLLAALGPLLRQQGALAPLKVTLTTEDCEYRDLGNGDLLELSAELPLDLIDSLSISSASTEQEPVAVASLLFEGRGDPCTRLNVEGSNQVAVDGIKVWLAREIEARLSRLGRSRESTGPIDRKPEHRKAAPWIVWLNHPWAIQVGGGAIAAVLGTVLILLLTH